MGSGVPYYKNSDGGVLNAFFYFSITFVFKVF